MHFIHQIEKCGIENAQQAAITPEINMKRSLSVFLDLLRIIAATTVMIGHLAPTWGLEGLEHKIESFGHDAVMVFFVISGYVITYSTTKKQTDAFEYTASRLARLYSVVLPALLLTGALLLIGSQLNPDHYKKYARGSEWLRHLLPIIFSQNIWSLSTSPPTNSPLWSLSYEFWYYAIFGCFYFAKNTLHRWAGVFISALVAGPPILLLMPCWLMGAAVATHGNTWSEKIKNPWVVFILGLMTLILSMFFLPVLPSDQRNNFLMHSSSFISDWLMAAGVSVMILAFHAVRIPEPSVACTNRFREWGDYTFPLYLLHYPLMVFFAATWQIDLENQWLLRLKEFSLIAVLLMLCYLCERGRPLWRPWLLRLMTPLRGWFAARQSSV